MIIRLCKVGLARLADGGGAELIDAIREREQTPVVRDCMDRCGVCEKGNLVATIDNSPIMAATASALLEQLDALIADENA